MEELKTYKDLIVWQKSMHLVTEVYKLVKKFPRDELYGLTSQMKRCAVSIPSNIAEGRRRKTKKEYHYFVFIAYGSGAELETQIEIAKRLSFGATLDFTIIDSLLNEVMRMLNKMTYTLNPNRSNKLQAKT